MSTRITLTIDGPVEVVLPDSIHMPAIQETAPTPLSYTIESAVLATGISDSQLRRYIKSGKLTARRNGTSIIIPRDNLIAFLHALPVARTEG